MQLLSYNISIRKLIVVIIGFVGVSLIGVDASPFGPAPMYIGLTLLLLGLPLLDWQFIKSCTRDPIVIFVVVLTIWVMIRGMADLIIPTMDPTHFVAEGWWHDFRVCGVASLIVGIWIAAYPRTAWSGIAFMVTSMLIYPIISEFWTELGTALNSSYRFKLGSVPNSIGLYTSALPAVGMLVIWGSIRCFMHRFYKLCVIMVIIGIYFASSNLLMLIATKSRHNWVAGMIAIAFVLIYLLWKLTYDKKMSKLLVNSIVTIIILILFVIIHSNWNVITKRWSSETQTVKAILTLQTDKIEKNALGTRWILWKEGLENALRYPVRGWGPGFVKRTLTRTDNKHIQHLQDYHSIYIHLIVSLGIVWFLLWMSLLMILLYRSIKKSYRFDNLYLLIGCVCLMAVLISGIAEYRFNTVKGIDIFIFSMGLLIGGALKNNEKA